MLPELIDSLRCVGDHGFTWLVARADHVSGRHLIRGTLGCPACGAEYPVHDGILDFTRGVEGRGEAPLARPTAGTMEADELALRAAALLGLTSPGGLAVLVGEWGGAAPTLVPMVDGVQILAVNPPAGVESGGGLSLVRAFEDVPVRAGAARGVALDEEHATPRVLAAAAAALRPGGRLVAPADAPVPARITVLARDALYWVAERAPDEEHVPLSRRRR
ncbi:MAG: hypothetical protein M3373_06055 [Gemmatimonadota bacterium]|nr:hypothetical protein [Gemmatimonadota bacterium]